jgi:hypothetical protein
MEEELSGPLKKLIEACFSGMVYSPMGQQQQALFDVGTVAVSRTVDLLAEQNPTLKVQIYQCLNRHVTGDCGDVSENDKVANFQAIMNGRARIHSAYLVEGVPEGKIWIITEWDRKITTVTTPEEA